MTSLAQQLQRLAVPYTQSLFAEDKKRVSLLFDPREAAKLDREAVFAIGQCGLEELQNVDPKFADYEETLYSLSSQNWERSLQTKAVNQQLDETIREFLILLSPYFPLKSAHKALEWLVYRYHIHQYNKDDLLLCVLPYHETNVFVRVLQILKLDSGSDKWHWLEPSAKSGVALARVTLITHCRKDPGFLSFILAIVPQFIKVHGAKSPQLRAVIAFYTCAMLGALEQKKQITERILSIVVPHLIQGLKSKCLGYKAADYMVLSQLVAQVPLKEDLLKSLQPVLSKHITPSLMKEAMACLTIVYQSQKITSMPKRTFRHMCKLPGIVLLLSQLSQQYNVDSLLRAWLTRLIPMAVDKGDSYAYSSGDSMDEVSMEVPQYASLLLGVLGKVRISSEEIITEFVHLLLTKLIEKREVMPEGVESITEWQEFTKKLLIVIERRYTKTLDTAVQELMSQNHNDESFLDVLQEMMSLTHTPVKYHLVPNTSTSLFLGLKHSTPTIRTLTLGHLAKYLNENQGCSTEFLEDLLLERFNDDSRQVVLAVLSIGEALSDVIPQEKLKNALLGVAKRYVHRKGWTSVTEKALELICKLCSDGKLPDLTYDLLPHLVVSPVSGHSSTVVMEFLTGECEEIFVDMKPRWLGMNERESEDAVSMNSLLFRSLGTHLKSLPVDKAAEKVKLMVQKCQGRAEYQFLVLCTLGTLVTKVSGNFKVVIMQSLLDLLLPMLSTPSTMKIGKKKLDDLFPEWVERLGSKTVATSQIRWAAQQLMRSLDGVTIEGGNSFYCDDQMMSLAVQIIDMTLKQSCQTSGKVWKSALCNLVQKKLPVKSLLKILCHLWTSAIDNSATLEVSAVCHVGSFHLLRHLAKKLAPEDQALIFSVKEPTFCSLVLSLLHPETSVRRAALECLQSLKEHCWASLGVHKAFMERLMKRSEEIIADPKHTVYVVGKFFSKIISDTPSKKSKKLLKSLIHWINISETPLCIKDKLLLLLSEVPHQLVLGDLLPAAELILKACSAMPGDLDLLQIDLLQHIASRIDANVALTLDLEDPVVKILTYALKTQAGPPGGATPQSIALKQINREFFRALPKIDLQCHLVSTLLDVGIDCKSAEFSSDLNKCMKQLKLNGKHILHELEVKDNTEDVTVKGKKRKKLTNGITPLNYPRLTLLLEVMQTKRKIKGAADLAAMLFALLTRLLQDDEEETEYCKQLVLSCLLMLSSQWDDLTKPQKQESLNIEVLVQCIRGSLSPQTQQQAMMVMSVLAPLYPEYILHNMMAVFTFMGSSLLQQDDVYSFQIISRTIDSVIPAILKACSTKGNSDQETSDLIQDVLRVFVDARQHIPKHRAMMLFHQLAEKVGLERHLWRVMVLLIETAVRTKDVPSVVDLVDTTDQGKSIDKALDFIANLCTDFDVSQQLRALTNVIKFQVKLTKHLMLQQAQGSGPTTIQKKKTGRVDVPVLALSSLSPQQMRLIGFHLTRLLVVILSDKQFVASILEQSEGGSISEDLLSNFQAFVQECLEFLTCVAKGYGSYSNTNTGKFWKVLLNKIYDVLDKVNYVLPNSVFLVMVSDLLAHFNIGIKRKVIELLNTKLQKIDFTAIEEDDVASLMSVIPQLLALAKMPPGSGENAADVATLHQMALFSLKLLCKFLGQKHPKNFSEMFDVTLVILNNDDQPVPVIGSALLCIAELCASLKGKALPYLPAFMPPLMKALQDTAMLKKHEVMLVCSLTALQKTIGSLSYFLSPYLIDILKAVCRLAVMIEKTEASKKPSIRLKAVRHQLATAITPRVLIPVLSGFLKKNMKANQRSLAPMFEIAKEHIAGMEKGDLAVHQAALVVFFTKSLDLRNSPGSLGHGEVLEVEGQALDMVLAMVMRLSETSFKPMFYEMFDWASRDDANTCRRSLTFFRLCEKLSENLKGLFNMFVGQTVKLACSLLDTNNTMHRDVDYYGDDDTAVALSCELLQYILGCLYKCFLYDTEGFVNKENFTSFLQPLANQLENMLGGESAYEERVISHVMPCISQLAVASNDDTCWKSLNYQVLLKTRHTSAKVRFATLQVIEDFAIKLGDEYSILLPETVPFLAELTEDDSEDVEQKCHEVVSSLEKLLGENIQQYF